MGTVTKQVIGVTVHAVITQYSTPMFYNRKTGRSVHSAFPVGVADYVNYGESLKTFAFLSNNRCNVSMEETRKLISEMTRGELCQLRNNQFCTGLNAGKPHIRFYRGSWRSEPTSAHPLLPKDNRV